MTNSDILADWSNKAVMVLLSAEKNRTFEHPLYPHLSSM
jgi:hypothetical protein